MIIRLLLESYLQDALSSLLNLSDVTNIQHTIIYRSCNGQRKVTNSQLSSPSPCSQQSFHSPSSLQASYKEIFTN
ncbi:hypothetical protein FGO68_gene12682 [Halteria grandinella]|uniref:Uncharacterized protein n=1 Tax=Halteria grandinella TaxID=5974 RepID=A0A8J8NFG0_HALGN|nr:hypothetical protein FGO68_gene12682 [Halteria grandinella]